MQIPVLPYKKADFQGVKIIKARFRNGMDIIILSIGLLHPAPGHIPFKKLLKRRCNVMLGIWRFNIKSHYSGYMTFIRKINVDAISWRWIDVIVT